MRYEPGPEGRSGTIVEGLGEAAGKILEKRGSAYFRPVLAGKKNRCGRPSSVFRPPPAPQVGPGAPSKLHLGGDLAELAVCRRIRRDQV